MSKPSSSSKSNGHWPTSIPDPEVEPRAARRRFKAAYKRRIVEEADKCTEPGAIGALLRREGLYSSQLATWRRQRMEGTLVDQPRGRPAESMAAENARLRRDNERLRRELEKAQLIMDAQKKLAQVLGLMADDEAERNGNA